MPNLRPISAIAVALTLAGCSGGGSAPLGTVASPAASSPQSTLVQVRIAIPSAAAASALRRRPTFVSPGTNGLSISVYADPESANPTPIATTVVDVSSASGACATTASGRTCTVSLPAPPGTDDFVLTSYDTAPAGGAVPATAKALGEATIVATVVMNATNQLAFALDGIVATLTLSGGRSFVSGTAVTLPLVVAGLDASGATIVAGTKTATNGTQTETDTYATPISLSIPATAHLSLSLNGAAGANSVSVTKSSDSVALVYDGTAVGASPVVVTAATSGATSVTASFVPLEISSTSTFATTSNGTVSLAFTATGQSATIAIGEANFAGAFTATVANAGSAACPTGAIALGAVTPGTTAASATVTVTANAAATGCTIAVSDGTSTATVTAVVTTGGTTIVIPDSLVAFGTTGTVTTYSRSNPATTSVLTVTVPDTLGTVGGGARDLQGRVYVSASDVNGGTTTDELVAYATGAAGTASPVATVAVGTGGTPGSVAVDAAGDVYVLTPDGQGFVEYAPALASTIATVTSSTLTQAQGIAVDPSGNVSVVQGRGGLASEIDVFAPPAAGTHVASPTSVISVGVAPAGTAAKVQIAVDNSGTSYVAQPNGNVVTYASGNLGPTPTTTSIAGQTALSVDPASGAFYASSGTSPYPISLVSAGTTTFVPTQTALTAQLSL